MRLTTQMKAELDTFRTRAGQINQEVCPFLDGRRNITFETNELFDASIQEMNTYKVRLENLLCETDKKEQAHL